MNLSYSILILCLLVTSLSEINADVDEFCTLSGNIKNIDKFSSISVKLFNKQGNLKEKTEVSETGFFILPIYDKGEYTIRVAAPAGYSFEPEEISFNFDGVNDICSQKKDVNFFFKGFGITGKVNILNEVTGAKGVNIKLLNNKNQEIRSTVTEENGIFTFSPIVPGQYKVVASHETWSFMKSEHSVTVSTGNTELPQNSLLISGFSIYGKMTQSSNVKMGVLIYSKKNQPSQHKCAEKLPAGDVAQSISNEYDVQPFCFNSQLKNEEFSFGNIASGRYLIVPYVDKNDIELHISPDSIETTVKNDNVKLTQSFEVSGFTASGQILVSQENKKGIKDATVKVNGKVVTTTDASGNFRLRNIKDGSYKIEVSANDLQFEEQSVEISMKKPKIPVIYVSGFKVCGKVVSEKSYKVQLSGASGLREVTSDHNNGGLFCVYLSNGKWSVEVVNNDENVQFYPLKQQIEVNSDSINDIIFSQLKAKVTGEVKCLTDESNSCQSVEVTLNAIDSTGYPETKQKIVNGKYLFEDVLPGRYQLTVPNDEICWEKEKLSIVVKSTHESVPAFVQNGYKLGSIISSHNAKASYKLRSAQGSQVVERKDIELVSGGNDLCVPKSGSYDLKVSGCHKFEEDTKVLTTKNAAPVYINAIQHQNGIRILSEISQDFTIEAVNEDGKVSTLKPTKQKDKVDGYVAYHVYLDLKAGEKVKLTPKSEQMLFKPDQTELYGATDCIDLAFNFIASKGLVIMGKTKPQIAGVKINLNFPKNKDHATVTTTTNNAGEFKFPTIDPTIDYELKAEKDSYVFSEFDTSTNTFHGHKLCEIIVNVKDESSKELASVVVSLSGGENYRKNLATDSNGEIVFHSLKPGKYYLRAMMKEYEFKPNSQTLDIKDGETIKVSLSAKRVAYSVFGKISTLGGDAFVGATVEAISTSEACSNHQEEAVTEPNGQYRIRGLQNGCDYRIKLQKSSVVDRSIPFERKVQIKTIDNENVNFIAISPITICDVIVKLKCKVNDHYKTLKVQMFKKDSPDSAFYTQKIENLMLPKSKQNDNILVFMPRINANDFHKTFFIEFTTTLSEKNYNFKLPSIQFVANRTSHYFEVEFNPVMKQPETELNKNSIFALILIFVVGFVFFQHELVFEFVSNVWSRYRSDFAGRQQTKRVEGKGDYLIDETEINKLAKFIENKPRKPRKNL